jgi:hypothetical protein
MLGKLQSMHPDKVRVTTAWSHGASIQKSTSQTAVAPRTRQIYQSRRQPCLTLLALASHSFLVTLMPLLLRWPVASDAHSTALLGKPAMAGLPTVACPDAAAAAAAPSAAAPCVCAASTPAVSLLLGLLLLLLASQLLLAACCGSAAAPASSAASWLLLPLVVLKLPMLWQPTEPASSSTTGAACCGAVLAETAGFVAAAAAVAIGWLAEGMMVERTPFNSSRNRVAKSRNQQA